MTSQADLSSPDENRGRLPPPGLERRLSCPVRRLNIRISACSRAIPASARCAYRPSPHAPRNVLRHRGICAGYAREAWLELAPELHRLHLLTILDVGPFSVYCVAYATWRRAEDALARESALTMATAEGHQRVNPLVRIRSQAMNDMLRYGAAFGLTPSGRLRLSGMNPPTPPSKFDGLLG